MQTLAAGDPPGVTCERLVALARRAGAPDNVTCIVADIVDEPATADAAPSVVGAASVRPQRRSPEDGGSAAERAAALAFAGDAGHGADDADRADHPTRGHRSVRIVGIAVVALLLAGGAFAAWHWVREQYFVGVYAGQVAVFRGLPQDLGPIDLATLDHTTGVLVDTLPPADQDSVKAGLVVDSSNQAAQKVAALRQAACSLSATPNPPPAASGSTVSGLPPPAASRPPGHRHVGPHRAGGPADDAGGRADGVRDGHGAPVAGRGAHADDRGTVRRIVSDSTAPRRRTTRRRWPWPS